MPPARTQGGWPNLKRRVAQTMGFVLHPRVLPHHSLLAGNEKTQSRTPPVGNNLQYRRPHQALGYLNPAAVPVAHRIPTKRMKVFPHLPDEYTSLTNLRCGVKMPQRPP